MWNWIKKRKLRKEIMLSESGKKFVEMNLSALSVMERIEKESKPSWWDKIIGYFKKPVEEEEPVFFNMETETKEKECQKTK